MSKSIVLKNVTKKFEFKVEKTLSVKTALIHLFKTRKFFATESEIKVLEDVSLNISAGEFVGIMGRNGAGKSTLLKLICGIYQTTSGEVLVDGTIAPLIELSAGFHPHLTGYENIFLNAAILGFSEKEVKKSVDEIVRFADIDKHIDLPVRKYSSGMIVRLGFAIATHLQAPILLVDEVLSVGDIGFQKKCLQKIREIHKEGRTIVLVTHDPKQVVEHCERCIVIDEAKVVFDGEPTAGVECYLQRANANISPSQDLSH